MIDSRLKYKSVTHPHLPLERTYCVNCGKPKGWVSSETSDYIRINNVIVICDDCEQSLGRLPLPLAEIQEVKGT